MTFGSVSMIIGFEPHAENAYGSAKETYNRVERANLYALGLKALIKIVPRHLVLAERNFDGSGPDIWLFAPHGVTWEERP